MTQERWGLYCEPGIGVHGEAARDPASAGRAEREFWARFDIRGFHGSVLGSGAVPLGVLDQVVTRWAAGADGRRA